MITRLPIIFLLLVGLTGWLACRQQTDTATTTTDPAVGTGMQASAAVPDWAADAVIYEVNTRQYTPEGTFEAFQQHLPRLDSLDVDILWFMPIYPISKKNRKGSLGSYYAISDYTAINPEFGSLADFRRLLDDAHGRGMKVILDWVPNHTGWDHAWISEHPDWYTKDSTGQITDPLDPKTGEKWGWTDVADLNYDQAELRQAMISEMRWWLDSVGVDGFRVDVAGEVPADFWAEASAALRQAKPDLFLLAEAEVPDHRNKEWFSASYGWSFHHLLNQLAQGKIGADSVARWYEQDRSRFDRGFHMQFITNHDENSWNGTVYERMGDAVPAMAVISFTLEGMPLIYSGQEAGLNKRLAFFEKDQIDWRDTSRYGFYHTLINLKHRNSALHNGHHGAEATFLSLGNPNKVLAYTREQADERVVVIINASAQPQAVKFDVERLAGPYVNVFSSSTTTLVNGGELELRPWHFLVLESR